MTRSAQLDRRTAERGGSATLAKPGESGLARLLTETAAEIVREVHTMSAIRPSDSELLEAKRMLDCILSDSGAQSLRGVATDTVPLRCRGDPFDLGRLTNLLDAVSDCRDYVSGELSKRGVPHIENPRTWNGY